jgi:Na+/H+ antiporter NhaA
MLRSSLFLIYRVLSAFLLVPIFSIIEAGVEIVNFTAETTKTLFCLKGLESHGIVRANIPPA